MSIIFFMSGAFENKIEKPIDLGATRHGGSRQIYKKIGTS
jgi:hypothetical protein